MLWVSLLASMLAMLFLMLLNVDAVGKETKVAVLWAGSAASESWPPGCRATAAPSAPSAATRRSSSTCSDSCTRCTVCSVRTSGNATRS